jgi:hypothetical protein
VALWIKVDGTEQEIQPQNGRAFTLPEMQACVGGYIEAVPFVDKLIMYINEDGLHLPHNLKATQLLRQQRPEHKHTVIYGDVLIASLVETGDEEREEVENV